MKKLLAVLLVLAMVFSFAACGGEETAKKAVDKGLTAVKNFDQKGMEKYFVEAYTPAEDTTEGDEQTLSLIFSTLSWKITSCEEEGDNAVAQVDLTCVSLQSIITDLFSEMTTKMLDGSLTDADAEEYTLKRMGEMIKEKDRETVTKSIELKLQKFDGQWKIINHEAVILVIASGLEDQLVGDEK